MKNIVFFILLMGSLSAQKNINYSIIGIPDSISKNAGVVVRFEKSSYNYLAANLIKQKYHIVKTIFNETGKREASLIWPYDKLSKVNDIEGNLYDMMGQKIKSLKNKDIKDFASYDGFSLATDNRIKEINFNYANYPYTVEYIVESSDLTTHHLLVDELDISQYRSQEYLEVVYDIPDSVEIETYVFNLGKNVVKEETKDEKTKRIVYKVGPTPCSSGEPLSDPAMRLKGIFTKFKKFEYESYRGNMNSWKDYGNFIHQLNEGRDVLPADEKKKVHELTDNINDDKAKVEILYKYMQTKTRYISIQYGIGGHQPFPASDVASLGYGDCKALSNYMHALLKEVGIKSNYSLIYAGSEKPSFPYGQFVLPWFNHAILMVPLQQDSVWLECTSQTNPFGYQGAFTGNRKALVIDKDNSQLVSTTIYDETKNSTERKTTLTINEDGSCKAISNARHICMNGDRLTSALENESKENFEKILHKQYDLNFMIDKFDYKKIQGKYPVLQEELHLTLPYYASKSGKRIFVVPNIFSRGTSKYTLDSNRVNELYLTDQFTVKDSIQISIPDGYRIESCPKDIHIQNQFGSYDLTYIKSDSMVTFTRTKTQKAGKFDKDNYNAYVKYNDVLYSNDRSKIVFVNKQ